MNNISYSKFVLYDMIGHSPSTKDDVPVQCPKCRNIKTIRLSSHLQTIRRNRNNYLCHKCSIDKVKCSKNANKLWCNVASANKVLTHLKSDKMKRIISEKNKRLFSDPLFVMRWRKSINREAISVASKQMWANPDFRKQISRSFSIRCKKQWKDPIYRSKISAYRTTEIYRKKMDDLRHSVKFKERMRQVWSDPVYREKMRKVALVNIENMLKGPSSQQKILYSILIDLNIKFTPEFELGYFLFDCLIPRNKPHKSLMIEVQGDYWHSLEKNIRRDKSKATYLRTYFPEYDLKYLWEHEFNSKDRIISTVQYWLGLNKSELCVFEFKDVKLKLINAKDSELFISKYHYAGRIGRSGVNIGYYIGDIIIAVCIFSVPVRQETAQKQGLPFKNVLELSRFCIHPSYQVKNLASHLISRSIDHIKQNKSEIKLLVSFADATYNHLGTIYKASNWRLDGEVAPDYWYADNRGYICHKKTLWNKAKQMSMIESQYCEKFGYMKVRGDKKFRYVYDLL